MLSNEHDDIPHKKTSVAHVHASIAASATTNNKMQRNGETRWDESQPGIHFQQKIVAVF